MFTGIVQGLATVTSISKQATGIELVLDLGSFSVDLQIGASVAVSGVCLTVTKVVDTNVYFFAMGETLEKTSLKTLQVNDHVNIERSAHVGDEIGGHLVSGHVTGTAILSNIDTASGDWVITLTCDPDWMSYLFPKGFIVLDGCSLTIVDVQQDSFTVHLIPETLSRTTFGIKKVGALINLEIDPMTRAVVDTVRRMKS